MGALSAGLITELAFAASDWSSVETQVLTLFEQHIGGDTLFFADERGPSDATRGVLVDYLAEVRPLWPSFSLELYPMAMAAQQRGGVLVDSDVFGTTMRAMAHYQQVMAPVRGRTTLIGALTHRGQLLQKVAIGRCWGSRDFRDADVSALREVIGALSLARAAFMAPPPQNRGQQPPEQRHEFGLTAREQEVVSYLRLGYTNRDIAQALGTSVKTVRNQLSVAYSKLGVANRAEAVGLLSAKFS
ncbi:MAG: response regulator transcription factor [Polyangiaceae bacterium]|nr:response regulator transcription factor [Myxococcales bacterium]MCB9587756.1 response regulator transcription factor [Polyangiaceae bacterium]